MACSSTGPAANADADADAVGDAAVDGGDGAPESCLGARHCRGNSVYACENGTFAAELEACAAPQRCSFARCTSDACATVESQGTGFAGCLFYAFEADNVDSDASLTTSFLVTNADPVQTASVSHERLGALPAGGVDWVSQGSSSVPPIASARFQIHDEQVVGAGQFPSAAIRVASDFPVTVALILSDDSDQARTSSSGGTMVWPVQALNVHYLAMTYPQIQTTGVEATAGGLGGAGRVAIVGTQAETHLTLTLPPNATAFTSSDPTPLGPGGPAHFSLAEGEVLQIYSAGDGVDLSGTDVLADRPVAVFSGNMTTTYGRDGTGVNSPDMVHEQMPPLGVWSTRYVAAALPPQAKTCDPLLGPAGASLWRILASQDDTQVTFSAPPGVIGLPSSLTLAAGQVDERVVSGGSFTVTATKPVLVTQGIDCEPSLSLAVSTDRFLQDLRFAVLPGFDQAIAVVRQDSPVVLLDDLAIDEGAFEPAGGRFSVAHVTLPPCSPSAAVCTHHLHGSFGMTLRGMDVLASYALTVPTLLGCANLSVPTCLP